MLQILKSEEKKQGGIKISFGASLLYFAYVYVMMGSIKDHLRDDSVSATIRKTSFHIDI